MNKDHDYGGVVDNQIRTWSTRPLHQAVAGPPERLPGLVGYADKQETSTGGPLLPARQLLALPWSSAAATPSSSCWPR